MSGTEPCQGILEWERLYLATCSCSLTLNLKAWTGTCFWTHFWHIRGVHSLCSIPGGAGGNPLCFQGVGHDREPGQTAGCTPAGSRAPQSSGSPQGHRAPLRQGRGWLPLSWEDSVHPLSRPALVLVI